MGRVGANYLPWITVAAAACVFGACVVMASMVRTMDVAFVACLMVAPFIPFMIATTVLAFTSRESDGIRAYCIRSMAALAVGLVVVWLSWFPYYRQLAGRPMIGLFVVPALVFVSLAVVHFLVLVASLLAKRHRSGASEHACTQCGYLLEAHAPGARCPECGHPERVANDLA